VRICLVGTGTVGRWLLSELSVRSDELERRHGFAPQLVSVANASDGFIHSEAGLEPASVLEAIDRGGGLGALPGTEPRQSALEGIRDFAADLLLEVSDSPRADGQPGADHMRTALGQSTSVATSNKWPVALHGLELRALAAEAGVGFRAESTVMSGTPVLSTLTEGLAGARPLAVRGVLNATNNFIATEIARGLAYEDALAEAAAAGLAEPDPSADVDGWDSAAKLMILAGALFDAALPMDRVERRGIAELDPTEVEAARRPDRVLRVVDSLSTDESGNLVARTSPELLEPSDPLAAIEGATNALTLHCEPLGGVTVSGPGAGPELAGQGVLADLIAIAQRSKES
jgi:homoserine dehydrogenase